MSRKKPLKPKNFQVSSLIYLAFFAVSTHSPSFSPATFNLPDLKLIIERWQTLSIELRQIIVKMMR
jgi:hypothetical protein